MLSINVQLIDAFLPLLSSNTQCSPVGYAALLPSSSSLLDGSSRSRLTGGPETRDATWGGLISKAMLSHDFVCSFNA